MTSPVKTRPARWDCPARLRGRVIDGAPVPTPPQIQFEPSREVQKSALAAVVVGVLQSTVLKPPRQFRRARGHGGAGETPQGSRWPRFVRGHADHGALQLVVVDQAPAKPLEVPCREAPRSPRRWRRARPLRAHAPLEATDDEVEGAEVGGEAEVVEPERRERGGDDH